MITTEQLGQVMRAEMQLHLWHVQTRSYAEHMTLDFIYTAWHAWRDEFLETLCGVCGERLPALDNTKIPLVDYMDARQVEAYLHSLEYFLTKSLPTAWSSHSSATDLANLRDEILGGVHRALYRITLV